MNRTEKVEDLSKDLGVTKSMICDILGVSRCWLYQADSSSKNDDELNRLFEYVNDPEYGYVDAKRIAESIPIHKRAFVVSIMTGHYGENK